MAKKKEINEETKVVTETQVEKLDKCDCKNCGKWSVLGWALLLFTGLAHMLPTNMGPLLQLSAFGVTLQTAVGIVSVVVALNFLLKE